MLGETVMNPRAISQTLQASASMLNVKVHDSTIRKRMEQVWLVWKGVRRKPLLSKKNMAAQNKPQHLWNNVLWTDEMMFGHNAQDHICQKLNTAYIHKHTSCRP